MVVVIGGTGNRSCLLRAVAAGAVLVVASGSLVACSRGSSPNPAASAFASALARGDISGAPLSRDLAAAQAALAETVGGIRGTLPGTEPVCLPC